jgi:CHASE2 domain-containing sensor protein
MTKKMLEILTLLVLILFYILLAEKNPIPANTFLLIAGGLSAGGINTNQITSISNGTITYATIDPIISYALMVILIGIAFINYVDIIDKRKKEKENEY